jgi:YidC/Oxa1 family membrane protein insertase
LEILSLLLSPLSEAMRLLLVAFNSLLGSYGMAIILLSVTVRILTAPITRFAIAADARDRKIQATMAGELREIKRTLKGRDRFEHTEELYRRHGYHPIKSVASLLPLLLNIPFLLSALFLLSDYPPLAGTGFLFIPDFLEPDGLISLGGETINLLPILITALALFESFIMIDSNRAARIRFLAVGLVIAILIYAMPAGVCLYWFTSTVLSFLRSAFQRLKAKRVAANQA